MSRNSAHAVACPNQQCDLHGKLDHGNIAPHGFSKVKWGRRRRYRCKECGKTWVFAGIEVWSRLWPATLVGPRTFRNTKRFVRSMANGACREGFPLITSDGFKFYAPAIRLVFGPACVLGQVIKKIRKNRVVRVATKLVIGSQWRLEEALGATRLGLTFGLPLA